MVILSCLNMWINITQRYKKTSGKRIASPLLLHTLGINVYSLEFILPYLCPYSYSRRVYYYGGVLAQTVKRLPTMRETRVWSLGCEDPLETEMAPHSSTLAWKIPWTEEPGRLQSMGSQGVGRDWVTLLSLSCCLTVFHWKGISVYYSAAYISSLLTVYQGHPYGEWNRLFFLISLYA